MQKWTKRALALISISLVIVAGGWYFMVISYSAELTTENEIQVTDSLSPLSNQSTDELAAVSFSYGEDNLEWSKLTMSISENGTQYDCTKSGLTSSISHDGPIQTKLNSDGNSFTIEVDSDSDDFVSFSFLDMQQTNESNYSIQFSKTDIFLGENISGVVSEEEFQDVNTVPSDEFTESSNSRLEWYDYDLSVHRVIPKDVTYIVNESDFFYKLKFLSYYDSDDESRHISFIVSSIGGLEVPAMKNDNITKEAHCIISSNNESFWNFDETIFILENGYDICSTSCTLEIEIKYLNQIVKGVSEIKIE